MKSYIRWYPGRFEVNLGWFPGDPLALFQLVLLHWDKSMGWLNIFFVQFLRFSLGIYFDRQ